MKLKLSKREQILATIFVIVSVFGSIDLIKSNNKNNTQTEIINLNKTNNIIKVSDNNYDKDILLKIENEIKNIVQVSYINKNSHSDEYDNTTNIEIQVSARIDNIFYIEDALKNIGLDKKISKIEIVKKEQNVDNEEEIINDLVDCRIELRGI